MSDIVKTKYKYNFSWKLEKQILEKIPLECNIPLFFF